LTHNIFLKIYLNAIILDLNYTLSLLLFAHSLKTSFAIYKSLYYTHYIKSIPAPSSRWRGASSASFYCQSARIAGGAIGWMFKS